MLEYYSISKPNFFLHKLCQWERYILIFLVEKGTEVKFALQVTHPFLTHKSWNHPVIQSPTVTISCLSPMAEPLLTSWTSQCWLLFVSFVQFWGITFPCLTSKQSTGAEPSQISFMLLYSKCWEKEDLFEQWWMDIPVNFKMLILKRISCTWLLRCNPNMSDRDPTALTLQSSPLAS